MYSSTPHIRYQCNYKMEAMRGLGVDRHLFGLYIVAKGMNLDPMPKMFSDKVSTRFEIYLLVHVSGVFRICVITPFAHTFTLLYVLGIQPVFRTVLFTNSSEDNGQILPRALHQSRRVWYCHRYWIWSVLPRSLR